jgi:hypothetical protein
MATTIVTKNGSGAPTASDLVAGELAVDLTNKRLYTEDSGGTVLELGTNPASDVTFGDNTKAIFGAGSDLQIYHDASDSIINDNGTGSLKLQQGGSTKLEVTTTGVDITGGVTATGIIEASDGTNGEIQLGLGTALTTGAGTYDSSVRWNGSSGNLLFSQGAVEKMRIDASGNVGIGCSPATKLHVADASDSNAQIRINGSTSTVYSRLYSDNNGVLAISTDVGNQVAGSYMMFEVKGTERMRIASNGDVGIGLNNGNHRLEVLNDKANFVATKVTSTSAATTEYGISLTLTNDPNDATRYFLYCAGGVTGRAVIYSNGNIANTNNSYTGISDLKLKENIVDAGSQWDDIKALRVRKYSFKEENTAQPTQIGVIAQEVEAAGMAGLVYESPDQVTAEDGTIEDTGEVTKTVKYSILYMKAVKALQEAMDRIETLEAKVAALES